VLEGGLSGRLLWGDRLRGAGSRRLDEGTFVFLIPDDGWKYLSSGV